MAALGHAPFGLWPIALVGFFGMMWLVAVVTRPGWAAFAAGVGYFSVALHWIVEPFLVDVGTHGWMAPGALILLSAGLALFWGASGWLAGRVFPHQRLLAFAVLLAGAEMLRGHVLTGFPWAMPAYIWADTPMRMAVSWTGSYGLTLIMLVALALPFAMGRVAGTLWGASLLGVTFALGMLRAETADYETALLGQVRLVQPNVPQREKWDFDKVPVHLRRLIDLSEDPEADLVIWPESAVAYPLHQAEPVLQAASEAAGVPVIIGLNRSTGDQIWHNALAVVGTDGTVVETYDKVHLVPFGEYIPFKIDFLRAMAASSGFGFTPGAAVRLIDTPLGSALPLICYEGIFPGHFFKADRPDYLLQITNDAWFGNFSGPFQHLDQMRFRAAEHGLSAVRAANTGVSAVIDHLGRVEASLDLNEAGYLDRPVHGGVRTVYSYTGDWPAILIILLTMAALSPRKLRNTVATGGSSS